MWEPKTWVQASLQSTGAVDSEGVAALSSAVEAGCSQHLPPGPMVTAGPGPAAAVRSANPSFPGTPGGLLSSVPPWEDLALSFGYSVRSSLLSSSQHRTHPGPPRVWPLPPLPSRELPSHTLLCTPVTWALVQVRLQWVWGRSGTCTF